MAKAEKPVVAAKAAKPTKKKYLTNKELLIEIELSHTHDKMTDRMAEMLMLLCNRYASRSQYANYSYNEDMRGFALMTCVKVWRGFNPLRSNNPFSYFTQIIKHAFYQYLNQERKQRNTRDALLMQQGDNPSFTYLEGDDDGSDSGYYQNYHVPMGRNEEPTDGGV